MYLGAHVSIAQSFDKSIDRTVALGANCLMTFASSPRSLQTKLYSDTEIQVYKDKKNKHHIGPHFFHGVYLINLATSKPEYLKVSIDSLIFYQQFAAKIDGVGTIFHIGSHQGRGFASVLPQIVSALKQTLENTPEGIKLILENTAGHSGTIGSFAELAQIIHHPDLSNFQAKIAICIDTQHAYASGYQLNTIITNLQKLNIFKQLSVIHFNNSLVDFDSHKDRHANLNEGQIPLSEMKAFLNTPQLSKIPFILETPGVNRSGPQKKDIDLLKSLQDSNI